MKEKPSIRYRSDHHLTSSRNEINLHDRLFYDLKNEIDWYNLRDLSMFFVILHYQSINNINQD